jgi:hypothetical protein
MEGAQQLTEQEKQDNKLIHTTHAHVEGLFSHMKETFEALRGPFADGEEQHTCMFWLAVGVHNCCIKQASTFTTTQPCTNVVYCPPQLPAQKKIYNWVQSVLLGQMEHHKNGMQRSPQLTVLAPHSYSFFLLSQCNAKPENQKNK